MSNGITDAQFKELTQIFNTALTSRTALLQKILDPTGRDLYSDCGYPETISLAQYQHMYEREPLAGKVVRFMPSECWQLKPEVYETEDSDNTAFESAWDLLVKNDQLRLWNHLYNVDEWSGIGHFGVLLLGFDDGRPLHEPVEVKKGRKLIYLRAFSEIPVKIMERESDITSPRYDMPTIYSVDFGAAESNTGQTSRVIRGTQSVHWSRIIHVAEGCVSSPVMGTPRMRRCFNRLLDVRKLGGGSAEMFWKGAFPGFSFELNPELMNQTVEMDTEAIKEQILAYMNRLQRYIAVQGMTVKSLSPQVSSPKDHLDIQEALIACDIDVPVRVFMGSEQGQLASGQDAIAWNNRVRNRQTTYCEPVIVRPFVARLMEVGVLPAIDVVQVYWPPRLESTDTERATVAVQLTTAVTQYVQAGADSLVPPNIFLTRVLGLTPAEVQAIEDAALEAIASEESAVAVSDPIGPLGGSGEIQQEALNGAQITSLSEIITAVVMKQMPPEAGRILIELGFPTMPKDQVRAMVDAAAGFKAAPTPTAPPVPQPNNDSEQNDPGPESNLVDGEDNDSDDSDNQTN